MTRRPTWPRTTTGTWTKPTATPIFVDTSALYAALNAGDENYSVAGNRWAKLLEGDEELLTSNYVLLETIALVGHRMGLSALRDFQTNFVPALDVVWVDETLHQQAVASLLTAGRRDLSLVDCVSFELMRRLGLQTAFAFDVHFVQQGFDCL